MFTLTSFQDAQTRIRPYLKQTPITYDETYNLFLKWENHHITHSFKERGAINKILMMNPLPPVLITGSAGNHGQAVARAAQITGTQAWVFVPEKTPNVKVNRMIELGAKVERVPGLFGDAEAKAIQTSQEMGVPFVSAYNDMDVIAGAGTIALEILEQIPNLERILVPVGGGGLISGIGLAAKALNSKIEIIGVLSEASPYMYHQYYYKHMKDVVELPTLTDGLAGAIEEGSITLELIFNACDAIVQISETEVASAIAYLYRKAEEVIEGSGTVGVAAIMAGKIEHDTRLTGTVISGGNIDPEKLAGILNRF